MTRATGLGGVFIRSSNPQTLCSWYQKHLGINFADQTFTMFTGGNTLPSDKPAVTVFSFFKKDTEYFNPSQSNFMLNFRVQDLESLLRVLKEEGVQVVGDILDESYGKFGWIMDPEGNKIELWEPKG